MNELGLAVLFLTVTSSWGFNFTYQMAAKCKEHVCQRGPFYDTFYRINREEVKFSPGVDFEMLIAILAPSNGHILLSSRPNPTANSPVYEIVVGGGTNKFTEIRRNKGKNAKMSAKTIDILSPIHFTPFVIRITDGTVEFAKPDDSLPILRYHDTDPLTINYFSFASWQGVEAKFLYDCPLPGSNGTEGETPDSSIVDPELSNIEKLREMLLNDRTPSVPPDPEVTVHLDCVITSIKYNAFDSKLETGISMTLHWTDETLAWNPTKFNTSSLLKFRHGEIWRPYFMVKNSISLEALDSKNPEPIYVVHSGDASLHFQSKITTWCDDKSSYLSRWPRDEYRCSIIISPWAMHEKINMNLHFSTTQKGNFLSHLDDIIENEWQLLQTQFGIEAINATDQQGVSNKNMKISLHFRRKALPYNLVFYTPLIVLVIFLLLSFWTQPLVMSRVWFYTGCVTIMSMGLSYIEYLVPTHTLPSIVILYACVLFGNLIAMLTQVILMHPFIAEKYKKFPIENIISNPILRNICCLKERPYSGNSVLYETIDEPTQHDGEDSGISTIPRRQEMESDIVTLGEGEEFADVIDKIMFLIYSIVFAVLLALHY